MCRIDQVNELGALSRAALNRAEAMAERLSPRPSRKGPESGPRPVPDRLEDTLSNFGNRRLSRLPRRPVFGLLHGDLVDVCQRFGAGSALDGLYGDVLHLLLGLVELFLQ